MTNPIRTALAAVLLAGCACLAGAQALKLNPSARLGSAAPSGPLQADYIVAVVNSEPITHQELRREVQRVLQQLAQARRTLPDAAGLQSEVLESLIAQKAQLQLARETGVRVEDSAVDMAEQNIAAQNQLSVAELRRRIELDGLSVAQFRQRLKDQIQIQRLRERDVEPRVRVTEADIDQYLADAERAAATGPQMLNLAQILIAVPEQVSPQQEAGLKAKAERVLARARAGEDFSALVREFSDAPNAAEGGQMGLRDANRYPELFTQAVAGVPVGGVSDVVRSGAGFHVLKVVERRRAGDLDAEVEQTHARHILLVPSGVLSEAQAVEKLADYKRRVVQGQADFAELARQHSQDGSAARGGDLGWASPGMFVPEFEDAMNRLAPGELSDPVISRFGVHLIQVLQRRQAAMSPAQQREAVRNLLREQKLDEAYRVWAQEVRARAYVELREPPAPTLAQQ